MNRRALAVCALAPAACLALAEVATAGATIEPLTTVRVASGLSRPVYAVNAPGDYTRLFIIEQRSGTTGRIRVLNTKTGVLNPTPFLAVAPVATGNEQGLLGLAFHPDYQSNGRFFVNYNTSAGDTIVAEGTVSANPEIANPTLDTILFIDQPFSNHNGGWMHFGPNDDDGMLYIGTGDGGSGGDPGNRAQDITNQLLGKMLRIDVDGDDFPGDPNRDYAIPADNPFVGISGDDEIWAYGLRNPWRNAFDRLNGDLYTADVGQNAWEEINFQRGTVAFVGGENYGWRCYEGNAAFNTAGCAPASTMVFPIHEYIHGGSPFRCSITGGYVYRGCAIPSLDGTYFFADYCSNQIWSFDAPSVGNFTDRTAELAPGGGLSITSITSFGEDQRGEIYICDQGGEVFKIIPVTPTIKPADVNCDGTVDVSDLLDVLAAWGPCDGCKEDFRGGLLDEGGDHIVAISELLDVLAQWD